MCARHLVHICCRHGARFHIHYIAYIFGMTHFPSGAAVGSGLTPSLALRAHQTQDTYVEAIAVDTATPGTNSSVFFCGFADGPFILPLIGAHAPAMGFPNPLGGMAFPQLSTTRFGYFAALNSQLDAQWGLTLQSSQGKVELFAVLPDPARRVVWVTGTVTATPGSSLRIVHTNGQCSAFARRHLTSLPELS